MDFIRRRRLSVFGHIARLTQGTPAHNALHCQVGLASGRSLGRDWRPTPQRHWICSCHPLETGYPTGPWWSEASARAGYAMTMMTTILKYLLIMGLWDVIERLLFILTALGLYLLWLKKDYCCCVYLKYDLKCTLLSRSTMVCHWATEWPVWRRIPDIYSPSAPVQRLDVSILALQRSQRKPRPLDSHHPTSRLEHLFHWMSAGNHRVILTVFSLFLSNLWGFLSDPQDN